jgi:hypothetical protein
VRVSYVMRAACLALLMLLVLIRLGIRWLIRVMEFACGRIDAALLCRARLLNTYDSVCKTSLAPVI